MDIKKKCINFKKNAQKLGYDLKLTHIQELIAKYEGFENRHAFLKEKKNKQKIWVDTVELDNKNNSPLIKASEVQKSINKYNEELAKALTIARKPEFLSIDINQKIEDFLSPSEFSVKMYISTDDAEYDFEESFIEESYMQWCIDHNRGFLEMLIDGDFGPDYHTDSLLFDTNHPKTKEIKNYHEIVNQSRRGRRGDLLGFSVTVDEDSFLEWKNKNKIKLSDKGFLI